MSRQVHISEFPKHTLVVGSREGLQGEGRLENLQRELMANGELGDLGSLYLCPEACCFVFYFVELSFAIKETCVSVGDSINHMAMLL